MKSKETAEMERSCALTGHRVLERAFDENGLEEKLKALIGEKKVTRFFCGMAIGFDLLACEKLVALRAQNPQIKIVACIPCPEQADKFGEKEKEKYQTLLSSCDDRVILSSKYTPFCMNARNRYMVDNAKYLLAYYRKEKGGTANTVRYALQKEREIIYL